MKKTSWFDRMVIIMLWCGCMFGCVRGIMYADERDWTNVAKTAFALALVAIMYFERLILLAWPGLYKGKPFPPAEP